MICLPIQTTNEKTTQTDSLHMARYKLHMYCMSVLGDASWIHTCRLNLAVQRIVTNVSNVTDNNEVDLKEFVGRKLSQQNQAIPKLYNTNNKYQHLYTQLHIYVQGC